MMDQCCCDGSILGDTPAYINAWRECCSIQNIIVGSCRMKFIGEHGHLLSKYIEDGQFNVHRRIHLDGYGGLILEWVGIAGGEHKTTIGDLGGSTEFNEPGGPESSVRKAFKVYPVAQRTKDCVLLADCAGRSEGRKRMCFLLQN